MVKALLIAVVDRVLLVEPMRRECAFDLAEFLPHADKTRANIEVKDSGDYQNRRDRFLWILQARRGKQSIDCVAGFKHCLSRLGAVLNDQDTLDALVWIQD